jgi:hypothetical protein
MRVILQTWCQMQDTPSGFRYMNCVPGHTQCIPSSIYSDFNIRSNATALLFEIIDYGARYTANLEPNIAHMLRFTLCELCSRKYTMYLQLRIYRPQYSTERSCAAIGDIPTLRCALYCKFGVKYSALRTVYAVWTMVPDIYKVFMAPPSRASIFSCSYLRCYGRYHINSMRVILHTWCQIHRTPSGLRYMNCVPGHIKCIASSIYSDFNIRSNVTALLFEIIDYDARYTTNLEPNIAHIIRFTLQDSIFSWSYLRCYWRCLDNSKRVILQTWCQI